MSEAKYSGRRRNVQGTKFTTSELSRGDLSSGRLVKMATSPRGDTSLGRQIWVRNVQEAICSGDETFQGVTFSETQSFNWAVNYKFFVLKSTVPIRRYLCYLEAFIFCCCLFLAPGGDSEPILPWDFYHFTVFFLFCFLIRKYISSRLIVYTDRKCAIIIKQNMK